MGRSLKFSVFMKIAKVPELRTALIGLRIISFNPRRAESARRTIGGVDCGYGGVVSIHAALNQRGELNDWNREHWEERVSIHAALNQRGEHVGRVRLN